MQQLFLSSKITVPKVAPSFIERTAINHLLEMNHLKRCTILRAPAGYGKTSVLNAWLQQKGESVAWVSLDAADNDFVRFWLYVVTSVANATNRELSTQQQALIQAKDGATFQFFLHAFIEELREQSQPIHIVLDDYHVITEQKIHLFVKQLIEYLPEQVHVYMTTRIALPLPIAKWRVQQWLCEISYEQLKFTLEEARRFFIKSSASELTEQQMQQIVTKTEGWVSGLLLTSLTNPAQHDEMIQPFVADFLWQEVLAEQSETLQHFLLQTALFEELDPAICDVLLEQDNSAKVLSQLAASGLFTVKLQTTYKYHPLLVEALRAELVNRLSAQEVRQLAERAATCLYASKKTIAAIELALRYELYPLALTWMEEQVIALFESGQTMTYMRWLKTVRAAGMMVQEELLIAGLMDVVSTFDIPLANELVADLEERQQQKGWMDCAENSGLVNLYIRTKAYFYCALGNRLPEVMDLLTYQLTREPMKTRWDDIQMSYNYFEPQMMRLSIAAKGKLISLEQVKQVIKLFRYTALRTLAVSPYLFGSGAEILYELDELVFAEEEQAITLQIGHEKNKPGLYIPMYLLKAKFYLYHKQPVLAQALLQEVWQSEQDKHWRNMVKIMQAYCFIRSGELEKAAPLLEETKTRLPFWHLTQARYLLAVGDYAQALSLVVPVKIAAQREDQIATLVEASILESICHDRLGNMRAATGILHEVVPFAARYGYVRTFLDEPAIYPVINTYVMIPFYMEQLNAQQQIYMKDIQQRLAEEAPAQPVHLTKREKQLLQLLVEGATNNQIAQMLGLSEGTVRVYLSTLYNKIGVASRVQAVLFGQQYGVKGNLKK